MLPALLAGAQFDVGYMVCAQVAVADMLVLAYAAVEPAGFSADAGIDPKEQLHCLARPGAHLAASASCASVDRIALRVRCTGSSAASRHTRQPP